jgi:pimeloyl-ACP methyl ester carboxylesterase
MSGEVLYVSTEDGWQLPLHIYQAQKPRFKHPVLMVHGLGTNRLNLDLDARLSVARAARERGFNVYLLELRGAGLARPPEGKQVSDLEWGFSEHREMDLPVAVQKALEHSGARGLHGFGHSMGGMLWCAFATGRPPELRSVSAVGSPLLSALKLSARARHLLNFATRLAPANAWRHVPIKPLLFAAGSFITVSSKLADGMLLNAENCDAEVMARMAKEGINDVPLRLLTEFARQSRSEARDGDPFDFERALGKVDVPVHVVSGSVDRVAPKEAVLALAQRLKGRDVRYREMGKSSGDAADYGHGDLLVGRSAPEEVFPLLLDFLEAVD